jgi:hypothetical protein
MVYAYDGKAMQTVDAIQYDGNGRIKELKGSN